MARPRLVARTKTRFQNVLIADSAAHGRTLTLDDELQSAERDEFIYHEALVHPAMASHPRPRAVLILGGEGATAREVLRHPTVREVVMVDLDGALVALCRKHLRTWHRGSFSDRRLTLVIGDAKDFIASSSRKFDIIIVDLPTPAGPGPLQDFYARGFFRKALQRLAPRGALVIQAGSARKAGGLAVRVGRTLGPMVRHARFYRVHVPSFGEPWGFVIASNGADPGRGTAKRIDGVLRKRGVRGLRFFDGEMNEGLFRTR